MFAEPKIYINFAPEIDLQTLPGVGPAVANNIAVYRQTVGNLTRENIECINHLKVTSGFLDNVDFTPNSAYRGYPQGLISESPVQTTQIVTIANTSVQQVNTGDQSLISGQAQITSQVGTPVTLVDMKVSATAATQSTVTSVTDAIKTPSMSTTQVNTATMVDNVSKLVDQKNQSALDTGAIPKQKGGKGIKTDPDQKYQMPAPQHIDHTPKSDPGVVKNLFGDPASGTMAATGGVSTTQTYLQPTPITMGVSIQNPTVSSQDPAMLQLLIPSSNTSFVQQATGGMMQQPTGGMVQQQPGGVIPSTLPANVSIAQIATQQPISYVQGITQSTVSTTQALTPQLGYMPGTTQPSIVTTQPYVQGIIPGNVQGTNTNTIQGIATSSVQGLVQQPPQQIGNFQPQQQIAVNMQQQQTPQVSNMQGNFQTNAQGMLLSPGTMQGIIQGGMGNVQGTVQNMGTGIIQPQGPSQGIQVGQSIATTPYAQVNPQMAGAGAGMGDQLFQQIKQMSVGNPMMFMALQEYEKRMLTNMTPIQNMAGVSPGFNGQGQNMYSTQPQVYNGALQVNNQGVPNMYQGQNQGGFQGFMGQNQGSPYVLNQGIQQR